MFGKLKSFEPLPIPFHSKIPSSLIPPIKKKIKKHKSKSDITNRMDDNLEGSKFRLINEYFYTNDSQKSFNYFQKHKEDFEIYHKGFREQIKKWPLKPVYGIIELLEKNEKFHKKEIIDLGCGEGFLYEHFSKKPSLFKKILSFDLISLKPYIITADIKKLPLSKNSADIAIFCLALMGLNYIEFLIEASRCLRKGGYLIIAEVASRMHESEMFSLMIDRLGYKIDEKIQNNNYFLIFVFKKTVDGCLIVNPQAKLKDCKGFEKFWQNPLKDKLNYKNSTINELANILLKPCIYKKR